MDMYVKPISSDITAAAHVSVKIKIQIGKKIKSQEDG